MMKAAVSNINGEPLFLPKEERDAAQMVSEALARDGVEIHLNTTVVNVRVEGGRKRVETLNDGKTFANEIIRDHGPGDGIILDQDQTQESRALVADFVHSSRFRLVAVVTGVSAFSLSLVGGMGVPTVEASRM